MARKKPYTPRPQQRAVNHQAVQQFIANRAQQVMPFFTGHNAHSLDSKRPYLWSEFGYPVDLQFSDYYSAYKRHGIGHAGVVRHIEKTWCSNPRVLEREDEHDETPWETEFNEMAERIDLWRRLEGADERNRVGQYAGVIFRYADSKPFNEPVDRVPGGTKGIVGMIPAFESQLRVSEWDQNPNSPNYGLPSMYHYNEAAIGDLNGDNPGRVLTVHPSRVQIWAEGADDGSIYGTPANEAGFNHLVDIEKIIGAGGEGFWKTARASLKLNFDKEADLNVLASMYGTTLDGLGDAIDEDLAKFLSGFDKSFAMQGGDLQHLSISLPSPEHFLLGAVQAYAASLNIPMKVLLGSQTGERASTEDAKEWDGTIMSRRERFVKPQIRALIRNWMAIGILKPKPKFCIEWDDLSAPSMSEKLDNAKKMAEVNRSLMGTGEIAFTGEEIRKEGGFDGEVPDLVDDGPDDVEPVDDGEV